MALSEYEQRQLAEIELGLAQDGTRPPSAPRRGLIRHPGATTPASRAPDDDPAGTRPGPQRRTLGTLIGLLAGVLTLVVAVVMVFSEADGFTLLVGCGLLAAIAYMHHYNLQHGI